MVQIIIDQHKIKPLVQGHRWVFSGAIKSHSNPQSVGLAALYTEDQQLIGYAFTDPDSQIACRIFHQGAAPSSGFKKAYWQAKFKQALQSRLAWLDTSQTNCFRLIHAEGDGLPGIIADVYGENTVVLHTLIAATGQWADTWISILREMGYSRIYHRHGQEKKGKWIGAPAGEIIIKENNNRFLVDVERGQKTGFFLDQRDSRKWIGSLSTGRTVLNAFSFTGGFSIYALQGGARKVVSVDISEEATNMAIKNASLNGFSSEHHHAIATDCFDYLRSMDHQFDLIILDPPAFAKSAQAVEKASRGYKDINLLAMKKIQPGGLLASFSCSQHISRELFRKILAGAAADAGREVRILGEFSQPADHPIAIGHPEGAYLKGLFMEVY